MMFALSTRQLVRWKMVTEFRWSSDVGGSATTLADETALRRMEKQGVMLTSTNQVMAELAVSWSYDFGKTILTIMYEETLAKLINK